MITKQYTRNFKRRRAISAME